MSGLSAKAAAVLRWLESPHWWALAIILPAVVATHLSVAAVTIRHSNQDSVASDQGAEMWLAATSRTDLLPQRTDGVRHPLWSWLARHIYTDDAPAFFTKGKWLNTALCVVFLCALGVAVTRWLDPLATGNLLLLCSLGILLVRGTYFQPEPLYYMLSFLAGVFVWPLLRGAAGWLYPVFGFVCGLAYLSKPSLLPFLLAFAAAFVLRAILTKIRREQNWPLGKNFLWLALAMVTFGLMLVPLGRFSHEAFGKPFFNYTKYWMWMDDFETEAWPWQTKYPGGEQLKTLPKNETPSLAWYFQRHSVPDALQRGLSGAGEITVRFFWPEEKLSGGAFFWRSSGKKWSQPLAHRGVYLLMLVALCAALFCLAGKPARCRLADSGNLAFAACLLITTALYVGLYGWYYPIGRGDRFMGSLWIPFVFLLVWWASSLRRIAKRPLADTAYLAFHAVILLSLLVQVAGIFWRFQQGIHLVTRN